MSRTLSAPVHAAAVGLLCMVSLCACRSTGSVRTPASVAPGAERAVYEALLREAYVSDETKIVVLDPELYWADGDFNWGPKPQGVPSDGWQALLVASRRGGYLPRGIDPGLPLAWFGDKQFGELSSGDPIVDGKWPAFHERFPGSSGHISLSRIGFSRDGRMAVVYGFVGSGSLSASGDLFVLRKTATGWRLVKTHNFAIA